MRDWEKNYLNVEENFLIWNKKLLKDFKMNMNKMKKIKKWLTV
jgi:hypothetical protein